MAEHDETRREVNRRTFLMQMAAIGASTSVLAACASAVAGGSPSGSGAAGGGRASTKLIGLQLYTVRDLLEKDFEGTVTQVAGVGYKNLEFAGYYNRTPEQVRALLDRLQLVSTSSHIGAPLMRQGAAEQIRIAKVIGQDYITMPSYNFGREGVDGWKKGAAEFNLWGRMCKDAGLKLAYHNHAMEFAKVDGDTSGYDVLTREVDPSLVDFELDLYWAAFAGQDPVALFAKHPGRFAMWHVKDLLLTPGAQGAQPTKGMAPVGRGTLDFKSYFAHAREAGLRHFFVEHDSAATYPGGSLASIQASYAYLNQILA